MEPSKFVETASLLRVDNLKEITAMHWTQRCQCSCFLASTNRARGTTYEFGRCMEDLALRVCNLIPTYFRTHVEGSVR